MTELKDITLLCNVVDNYGDIGFVYRLSRALKEYDNTIQLRLVVNDLHSFAFMAPGLDEHAASQMFCGMKVLDWNAREVCKKEFSEMPATVILQCFQCERPDWLEEILFAEKTSDNQQNNKTLILNVEYLTAENWAEEFHLLPSATRSACVKKVNFMPGFTSKTGGLVLDRNFMKCCRDRPYALSVLPKKLSEKIEAASLQKKRSVLVFAYPRDFMPIIQALNETAKTTPVQVFCATPQFSAACKKEKVLFDVTDLEPLSQQNWDALITLCDFLFIRGEDSFSRACLSGKPFVWSAYVQDEEFHLVKVCALLDRMSVHFSAEQMALVSRAMLSYNRNNPAVESPEVSDAVNRYGCIESYEKSEHNLFELLQQSKNLTDAFSSFSESLIANGNLAEHLTVAIKALI